MTEDLSTETVAGACEAVRRATRALIAAAERGDVDAIHQSIDERSVAIQCLEAAVKESELDRNARKELARSLALQADDAETALKRLMESSRQELQALSRGARALRSYAAHLDDPDTLALCRRVHTVVDERAEAEYPANMAGVVRVRTRDGTVHERMVAVPRGEPGNFLTGEQLRAKFDGLVGPYLPEAVREGLANGLLGLDTIADVRQIMALARTPGEAPRLRAAGGDD